MPVDQDYREYLLQSYQQKRGKNMQYSLRAFARDLAISPSRLSEVMAGKGQLSGKKAQLIAKNLKFPAAKARYFCDLVDVATAKSQAIRDAARKRLAAADHAQAKVYLEHQVFEPIARWQNIAIWSYLSLPAYDGDLAALAASLKLDLMEVCHSLHQLRRARLVDRVNGRWVSVVEEFSSGDGEPSHVIRKYHDSVAALGRASIEGQTFAERHLETMIMPFASGRLAEVSQRIGDFAQSLMDEFGDGAGIDRVYALSLQFFRLGK